MAATSSARRRPVVATLLVVVGLLLGGGIAYFATGRGQALLPALEQPALHISSRTRAQMKGQFLVKLRNHVPLDLRVDSLSYTARGEGQQLAQGPKARPLVVKGNALGSLSLPLKLNLPQLRQPAKTAQLRTVLYAGLPGVGTQQMPVEVRKRVYIPKLREIKVADVDITKLGLKKGKPWSRCASRITGPSPSS